MRAFHFFAMAASAASAVTAVHSAAAAMPVPPAPIQTIDVRSFAFAPKPLRLAAGQPVTLNFVNRSGSGHDFTAPAFFAASRILAGSAAGGMVELPPHAARSITLVPAAGRYKAHCSHFGHQLMGMSETILVG